MLHLLYWPLALQRVLLSLDCSCWCFAYACLIVESVSAPVVLTGTTGLQEVTYALRKRVALLPVYLRGPGPTACRHCNMCQLRVHYCMPCQCTHHKPYALHNLHECKHQEQKDGSANQKMAATTTTSSHVRAGHLHTPSLAATHSTDWTDTATIWNRMWNQWAGPPVATGSRHHANSRGSRSQGFKAQSRPQQTCGRNCILPTAEQHHSC